MKKLLENKVAIITGGASGLGLASAERFIEEGAKVVIADIQDELGAAIVKGLGENAFYVNTDVSNEKSIENAVKSTVEHFGKLDIMFNNAGVSGDPTSILDIEPEKFDKILALDVSSVIFGHKYAARQFKKQGTGGSIITTASIAAVQGGWFSISYATAKHAIVGTIRHAAKELSPYRIRTNAVAPGVIMTPLIAKGFGVPLEKATELTDYLTEKLGSKQALGRYGTSADIANTALFLASDLSSYLSGVVIPVDGGISSYTESTSDADILNAAQEFLGKIK